MESFISSTTSFTICNRVFLQLLVLEVPFNCNITPQERGVPKITAPHARVGCGSFRVPPRSLCSPSYCCPWTTPSSKSVPALNPSGYILWSVPALPVLLTYEESTLLLRSGFCLLARFRQKVKFKNSKIE
jgi:hypothetical protein